MKKNIFVGSKFKGFTQHHFFCHSKKSGAGFTLIELLVVIAIIGLLSTLAVVALNSAREKARDAKRVADIRQVQTALELFYNDANGYPVEVAGIVLGDPTAAVTLCYGDVANDGADGFVSNVGADVCDSDATVYMGLVPENPGPGGIDYTYEAADNTTYQIDFELEGGTGSLNVGPNCATPNGIIGGAC